MRARAFSALVDDGLRHVSLSEGLCETVVRSALYCVRINHSMTSLCLPPSDGSVSRSGNAFSSKKSLQHTGWPTRVCRRRAPFPPCLLTAPALMSVAVFLWQALLLRSCVGGERESRPRGGSLPKGDRQ